MGGGLKASPKGGNYDQDIQGSSWWPLFVGEVTGVYEERDPERMERVQSALDLGTLTRNLIYQDTGATLNNPTSLAFDCSIAGQPMAHWTK